MISSVFIKRPILAGVLSAFIVIAGLASLRSLPVAQYPRDPATDRIGLRFLSPVRPQRRCRTVLPCRSNSRSTASRACST